MNTRKAIRGGISKRAGVALLILCLANITATRAESPDFNGPKLVAAIMDNTQDGVGWFGSNVINVVLSEPVNSATARNTNNFTLTRIGSTNRIPILSVGYSSTFGILLAVNVTNADWAAQLDYVLTVNNLRDTNANVIAPDSQVSVSRPQPSQLVLPVSATWSHHVGFNFEPDIYDQPWEMPDYVESPWWQHGPGPFCGYSPVAGEPDITACLGPCRSSIVPQQHSALFRTSFFWPTNFGPTGYLSISTEADDAIIVYLNGREIWRNNLPRQITRLSANPGFTSIWEFPPGCITTRPILVTNLLSGANWLAVGTFKASVGNVVEAFALQVSGAGFRAPPLLDSPPPALNMAVLNHGSVRLSWSGQGYALEGTTNLTGNSSSYPLGPWQEVSNMTNPYTNSASGSQRFFRLKK